MKKIGRISLFLVLALLTNLFISNSIAAQNLPRSTKELPNIDQLRTCFSKSNANLDVMFLMDISKSMNDNDRHSQRKEMVKGTIELLSSLAEDNNGHVFISFATFGHALNSDNAVRLGWKSLASSKSEILNTAENWSNNKNAQALGTDWKGGLQVVSNAINKRQMDAQSQNMTSCPVLIWMTDGQIDPENHNDQMSPVDVKSFAEICEGGNPLIDSLKGTTILGALLSKPMNELANELPKQKSVFLFQSVIEGSIENLPGDVFSAFDLGSAKQTYVCGNPPNAGRGKLIQEKSPTALAWEFVDLVAVLADLIRVTPKSETEDKVTLKIDSSLARVVVYVKKTDESSGLRVLDADGTVICQSYECEKTNQSNSVMNVYEVKIPEGSSPGNWTFETGDSDAKYFASLKGGVPSRNLKITISNRNFDEGKTSKNQTTFTLEYENGDSFRDSDFSDVSLRVEAPSAEPSSGPITSDSFTTSLVPTPNDTSVEVSVTLHSVSLDADFVITDSFDIKVMNLGLYPSLDCSGGTGCELNQIPNESTASRTDLKFKGATNQDTYIRLKSIDFTNDDNGRLNGYTTSFINGSNDWVLVPKNGNIELPIEVRNSARGVSCGSGSLVYEVKDANQNVMAPISETVLICTGRQKDYLSIIAFYLLFVLIGVGLPYLYLLYDTRKAAVFTTERYKYVKTPVLIKTTGTLQVPNTNLEEGSQNQWRNFELPPYNEVSRGIEIESGTREIGIGPVKIEVIPPKWNPFAQPVVNLVGDNLILYSNSGSKAKLVVKNESSAALDISRLQFIAMSESAITPVAKQSLIETDFDDIVSSGSSIQNSVEAQTGDVEGTLYVLLPGFGELGKLLSRANEEILASNWESFMDQITLMRVEAAQASAESSQESKQEDKVANDDWDSHQEISEPTISDDDWDSVGNNLSQSSKPKIQETQTWKNEFDD